MLLTQVANYGFPIVLSWYLLVRMEAKLEKLNQGIAALREAVLLLSKAENK
ncbi:MAG: YvrJ family protein [Acidaminococcaceae bacterium]